MSPSIKCRKHYQVYSVPLNLKAYISNPNKLKHMCGLETMARTSLGTWKFVLGMGIYSHS